REVYAADRDHRFRRQPVAVLEPAARRRLADRRLYLALRRDAQLLEELAHADVEGFLVHGVLLRVSLEAFSLISTYQVSWPGSIGNRQISLSCLRGRAGEGATAVPHVPRLTLPTESEPMCHCSPARAASPFCADARGQGPLPSPLPQAG